MDVIADVVVERLDGKLFASANGERYVGGVIVRSGEGYVPDRS